MWDTPQGRGQPGLEAGVAGSRDSSGEAGDGAGGAQGHGKGGPTVQWGAQGHFEQRGDLSRLFICICVSIYTFNLYSDLYYLSVYLHI